MQKKVFGTWLRELCTLVFVQSMQALLLLIMLSVVVSLYIQADGATEARVSMGVYAIFVLSIIPKVELLVKKIFGLGSGVADASMMGGKQSLLKTGIALRLGGRVLNNAGKIVSGGVGLLSSAPSNYRQKRIAQNNLDAAKLNKETSYLSGVNQNLYGNSTSSSIKSLGSSNSNESIPVGNIGLNDLTTAIKNANAKDPEDELRRIKHEQAQKRLENIKKLTSGVTETVGAIGGASIGAVVGLGTGGDDIITNAMIGAGIGDTVGQFAAESTLGNAAKLNDYRFNNKELKREVAKTQEKKVDVAQKQYDDIVNQLKSKTNPKSVNQLSSTTRNYRNKAVNAKNNGDMNGYRENMKKASENLREEKRQVNDAINRTKKSLNGIGGISKPNRIKNTSNSNNVDSI